MLRPIRVLYLCEYPSLLGGERSLLCALEHAGECIKPIVVAPAGGPLAAALSASRIEHWRWPAGGKSAAAKLASNARAAEIDIVHANSLSTAPAARELASSLSVAAVAHIRDIVKLSAAKCALLAQLRRLIAVSDAVRTSFECQGLPSATIARIYNPLDVAALQQRARPGELRVRLGLRPEVRLVGCVGQIGLRKGQDVFIEAASFVAERIDAVEFVFVGERCSQKDESIAFERRLRERMSLPPLAGRVHWLGYDAEWPRLLCDLDLLIVPSRQEPLSRVLLEAVALGVPAVAAKVGGMSEILIHSDFGTLVPCGDAGAMADAAEEIISSRRFHQPADEAARRTFEQRFSPTRHVDALMSHYESLLERVV